MVEKVVVAVPRVALRVEKIFMTSEMVLVLAAVLMVVLREEWSSWWSPWWRFG
jgi:hypothetical protein